MKHTSKSKSLFQLSRNDMEHTKACPVCAEREVLAGYNDLATTDSQLLSEWDYEQNKLKPTQVS